MVSLSQEVSTAKFKEGLGIYTDNIFKASGAGLYWWWDTALDWPWV